MCTNYVPTRGDRLQTFFAVGDPGASLRNEVWPGYMAPVVRAGTDPAGLSGNHPGASKSRDRTCVAACFGLIPGWSRDGRNFRHCYNARSETVAEKPSFRQAWRKRQFCVIPADAFFEPCYESGRPVRWRIGRRDDEPFALAGMWEAWRRPPAPPNGKPAGPSEGMVDEEGWLLSFTLLTVNADSHAVMNGFHAPGDEKRSIVSIPLDAVDDWLHASEDRALAMLCAPPAAALITVADPKPPARRKAPAVPIARARPTKPS